MIFRYEPRQIASPVACEPLRANFREVSGIWSLSLTECVKRKFVRHFDGVTPGQRVLVAWGRSSMQYIAVG